MGLLADLQAKSKDELVNTVFNARVANWADYDKHDYNPHAREKRIPYLGWFWRSTDFVNKRISIGDAGELIGVMENNKWDYPERDMTPEEADTFIAYLERAFAEESKGGNLAETLGSAEKVFLELWDWFQTLEI